MSKQLLNEMKKFIQIAEGAWELPESRKDFLELRDLLNRAGEMTISQFKSAMYNIIGDDDLFDSLDEYEEKDGEDAPADEVAKATIDWMKKQRTDKWSNYPNIWNDYQLATQDTNKEINEEEGWKDEEGRCKQCKRKDCTCGPSCDCEPVDENEENDFMHDIQLESVVTDVLGTKTI